MSATGSNGPRVQVAPPTLTAGCAMPPSVRHRMETSFGTDFSDVRIHEDHSATMLGATAYTSGNAIHFAPGTYDPHSAAGQNLLSHELVHVVQQRQGRARVAQGLVENPDPRPIGATGSYIP